MSQPGGKFQSCLGTALMVSAKLFNHSIKIKYRLISRYVLQRREFSLGRIKDKEKKCRYARISTFFKLYLNFVGVSV